MPLLLVTGFPSCGKSAICERILAFFADQNPGGELQLHIVSDRTNESNFSPLIYGDPKKEKQLRSALRAKVQRLLHRKSLVICDSTNHIKGYRYELFCLAKNTQTRYAVLHCKASPATCKWLNGQRTDNERYPDEILSNLFNQFETPDQKNRWDAPLFEIQIGRESAESTEEKDELGEFDECINYDLLTDNEQKEEIDEAKMPRNINLPFEQLHAILIKGKELSANKCMKVQIPMVSSAFLVSLDQQTQEILDRLLVLQSHATDGDELRVFDGETGQRNTVTFHHRLRSLPQLSRLRQQFIAFMKTHPIDDFDRIGPLFTDYLNSNSH
ncbi:hypothetical protein niasHT_017091 [Heterodera trifolii]|uniref:Protein KTI12 homolog n=1 Tax=Heterodera trifolii TaxID=157864 RepID=A0ABD2L033_9BILA